MRQTVELITPDVAKEMLKGNHGNRNLRLSAVTKWVETIKSGGWVTTPQGIILSPSGRLLDGQHRLTAVVTAGIPVQMVVWRDVPESVYPFLDRGAGRSLADATKNSPREMSIATAAFRIANNNSTGAPDVVTLAVYESFKDDIQAVVEMAGKRSKRSSAPILVAAVAALAESPANKEWILRRVYSFTHLSPDIPAAGLSLLRQMDGGRVSASADRVDLFVRARALFNPGRENNSKIQVKDASVHTAELKRIIDTRLRKFAAKTRLGAA